MSKALKSLENIKREAGIPYFSTLYDIDMWREDFKTVETALKAIEIIKDKEPSIFRIRLTKNSKHYNAIMPDWRQLTKEEFNLLKEVFS